MKISHIFLAAASLAYAGAASAQSPKDIMGDFPASDSLTGTITANDGTALTCLSDMPCGDTATEEDLRLANAYCEQNLRSDSCPVGFSCATYSSFLFLSVNPAPHTYVDKACEGIVHRWEQSKWKRDQDAAQAREKAQEIEHEKAFVEAVAKQHKGQGE